mgnify:CR=1 FL=1
MNEKLIKTPTLYRDLQFDRAAVDAEKRTVSLAFSSELPVERYFGVEILDHSPESVDLSRINNAGALLVDHNTRDQIGVIERAEVGPDRKARAVVRFGNSARAKEIFQDVQDGIRQLVSVGYRINKMVTEKIEKGVETLRAVSWTPMEISFVSVPADASVGVGRGVDETFNTTIERKSMSDETKPASGIEAVREPVADKRTVEIMAIAERIENRVPNIRELAKDAIAFGTSLEEFRKDAIARLPKIEPVREAKPLDVKPKDWARYSLSRVCNHLASQRPIDGFEREMSDEMSLKAGRAAEGLFVPQEVFARNLIAGTGTLGGMLVQTSNLGDQMIELLRNKAQVLNLGARVLNLENPVTIPRQSGAGGTNWVGETVAATLSTGNFTQITLTPNAVSAFQQYSKQLLATNNPSIDSLIRDDIVQGLALAIDLAMLHGTGSGQPTGIFGTTGIGSVALAASGQLLANTTAYPAMVSLETLVATGNADVGSLAYLMRAGHRGSLKTSARFANSDTPVWETNGTVNGYRAEVTNQIATNLTTGTATTICSAILFGNWGDAILGQFAGGATDLVVDPYTLAVNGVVRVIARRWVDVGVRHPASFAALGGIL